jgi:hypothetical protein
MIFVVVMVFEFWKKKKKEEGRRKKSLIYAARALDAANRFRERLWCHHLGGFQVQSHETQKKKKLK